MDPYGGMVIPQDKPSDTAKLGALMTTRCSEQELMTTNCSTVMMGEEAKNKMNTSQ